MTRGRQTINEDTKLYKSLKDRDRRGGEEGGKEKSQETTEVKQRKAKGVGGRKTYLESRETSVSWCLGIFLLVMAGQFIFPKPLRHYISYADIL